ncbi:MAG: hypothetical protein WBC08_17155 [Rhodoferax sp.]|jgi:hypothetical protein|nr:hypothetical protein [Rhodoferax sp.]
MTAPYKSEVDGFIAHFEGVMESVGGVASPLHRKILYATALDPLARAAYGYKGNRDRLTQLIRDLSKWTDSERVSLPQLQLKLRLAGLFRRKLYRHVSLELQSWGEGVRVGLQHSPHVHELASLADTAEMKLVEGARYSELFYTYRNNLVHEFREPGYGWDVSGTAKRPFYMSYLGREGQWELTFPVHFFRDLVTGSIESLKVHLLAKKIDPYKQFNFGSIWRGK